MSDGVREGSTGTASPESNSASATEDPTMTTQFKPGDRVSFKTPGSFSKTVTGTLKSLGGETNGWATVDVDGVEKKTRPSMLRAA